MKQVKSTTTKDQLEPNHLYGWQSRFELNLEHLPQHQTQNLEKTTTTSSWFKNENEEQPSNSSFESSRFLREKKQALELGWEGLGMCFWSSRSRVKHIKSCFNVPPRFGSRKAHKSAQNRNCDSITAHGALGRMPGALGRTTDRGNRVICASSAASCAPGASSKQHYTLLLDSL